MTDDPELARALAGLHRHSTAEELCAVYEQGAIVQQLITATDRSAGWVRRRLDSAGTRMRPPGRNVRIPSAPGADNGLGPSPTMLRHALAHRLGRALRDSTAPRRFCIAELALTRPVLDAEGRHAQHAHLAGLDQLGHVQARVLPHGADELLCHDFQLRNGQALVESLAGLVDLPEAESVFRPRFDRLWDASIPYRTWYRQRPD